MRVGFRLFFYGRETFKESVLNEQDFFQHFEKILQDLGYALVELTQGRRGGGSWHFSVVIYKADGVSLDDCAEVHQELNWKLENELHVDDYSLEVSSPGLTRVFKSPREYEVFAGRLVEFYSRSRSNWLQGILRGLENEHVLIETPEEILKLELSDIAKGRFVYQEGGKNVSGIR